MPISPETAAKIRALNESLAVAENVYTTAPSSVASLETSRKAYDVIQRAHIEVGEAIMALEGDEIATAYDADYMRGQLQVAIKHLYVARKHAHDALKAVMPQISDSDYDKITG